MIYTSCFSNNKALKAAGIQGISIARWAPRWWGKGNRLFQLAPSIPMVKDKSMTEAEYIRLYEIILAGQDPQEIAKDLDGCALLCWEKPGEFCHRRLVAEWLEKNLGIEVPEFTAPPKQKKVMPQTTMFFV